MPKLKPVTIEVVPEIDWTDAIEAIRDMALEMAKIGSAMTNAAYQLSAAQERRVAARKASGRDIAVDAAHMDDDALVASEIAEGAARAMARWVSANRDAPPLHDTDA